MYTSLEPQNEVGRLQSTFQDADFSSHGSKWDSLWKESYTPWDRGGPSLALADLLAEKSDLFPKSKKGKKTALVPGCGRGYDVLLLSVLAYDVVGLDFSAEAVKEAIETQKKVDGGSEKDMFKGWEAAEKGTVTWVQGDYFDDAWLEKVGKREFDIIFDYTFFCALPPEARPKWAKRMAQLVSPDNGRLICLEWPLDKNPSTGGPPWGLSAETYVAHLGRPGEEVRYGEDGKPLADELGRPAAASGLKRLDRIKPCRTHKAGHDGPDRDGPIVDFISVWSH